MIYPVVLCGGSGTRLWPLSQKKFPKQFIDFGDGLTLFKKTIDRVNCLKLPMGRILVVTSSEQESYVKKTLNSFNCEARVHI